MSKTSATQGRHLSLAFRRFFSTIFLLRCPHCGQGKTAAGFFNIKTECELCHAKFERGDAGNWLAAATLNYTLTAIACALLTLFLVRTYGFFDGLTFVIAGFALLLIALLYRPAKTLGLWVLWLFGFIHP